jgi:hypothetical protein
MRHPAGDLRPGEALWQLSEAIRTPPASLGAEKPVRVLVPIVSLSVIGNHRLNGTSSVPYGTVADLVTPERRSRAYGLFYTLGVGSGAEAPAVYGLVSDLWGVPVTLGIIGLGVSRQSPLSQLLRAPIAGEPASHPLT